MSDELRNFSPDEKWVVLESMFDEIKLVQQHLNSYNYFIEQGLKQVVQEERLIELDPETGYNVELKDIDVKDPRIKEADGSESEIWPADCRTRNLTYSAPLYLTMVQKFTESHKETKDKKRRGMLTNPADKPYYVGHIPIMLKSKKCRLTINSPSDEVLIREGEDPKDSGAYFIVNGSERVLVTQEDLAPNRILVERLSNGNTLAKVFSSMKGFRAPVSLERANDGSLKVSFPSVPRKISLMILLRALGLEKEGAISRRISSSPSVYKQVLQIVRGETIRIKDEALDFIGRRVAVGQTQEYRISRTEQVLDRYLLPHLGNEKEDRLKKAYFLCLMAQKVLELEVGEREADDKDHYASKRLNLAGDLLLLLFRNAFRSLTRDIKYQLERNVHKKGSILQTAVRADVITERLRHALATGNWVGGKAGVSQLLDRTNYMSSLSHLRRVVSPLSRSQPHFEARDLHPTHWGKICITPDSYILLEDGSTQVRIQDIENDYLNTKVLTVDENSHDQIPSGLVAFQKVSAYDLGKKVYEISSITGRKIKATEDHPFLTLRGWIEAGQLKLSDKLLVRPTLSTDYQDHSDDEIITQILNEEEFLKGEWTTRLSDKDKECLESDSKELASLGLMPLFSDNEKLPIISRLLGITITDGSISKTPTSPVEFYLGTQTDANKINTDIQKLGYSINPVREKISDFTQKDGDIVNYKTFYTTKGGSFKRLLVALGAPVGRRTEQSATFPDWIHDSSPLTKREFLGAFLGGDGAVPWAYARKGRKDSYKIVLPVTELHKAHAYVDSQISFFEELSNLFEDFNVKINRIKTKKLNEDRTAIRLVFVTSKQNIKNLVQNIGFRYAIEKENKAQIISEYLHYRQVQVEKRIEDTERIITLYNDGRNPVDIAKELNIGYRVVTSIIQRAGTTHTVIHPKSAMSVGKFFEQTKADVETGMLYVPIAGIQEVDEDIVLDFTTQEDTHSFIANGFVTHNCPNETPEGPNCGLVKNLALQAYISTQVDTDHVIKELRDLDLIENIDDMLRQLNFDENRIDNKPVTKIPCRVYHNGELIGFSEDGNWLADQVRKGRRNRLFSPGVNIAYYDKTNEIYINSDHGRVRRPLIIVKGGIPQLKLEHVEQVRSGTKRWTDLTRQGLIEYLDSEEEENALIAINTEDITKEYTHLEISAATILGICASLIPFPEHNRSDRNVYEAGMAKQSLGIYAANFKLRLDTRSHILHYPQIPLVKTHGMKAIGFNERPAGQNFVVAVLSYNGYNMEDALILNKSSIDRGLGRSTFFRSYDAEERRYPGGQEDQFERPTSAVRGYRADEVYKHLSDDGVVEPETEISGKYNEVIIGRTSPPRFSEANTDYSQVTEVRRDTSINMRFGESGVADTVIFTETSEGHRLIKVKVRSLRIPELGDKFASRHGQKGIVGVLIPQEDMPFTETGLSPDLLINPHAIPSRMTIGQLMELLAGKLSAVIGDTVTATAFEGVSADEIKDLLHSSGFQKYGRETMYDGRTGEKLESDVFMGIAFYQKLHHLVNDKIHARARGPVQILTRQPTEGRSREGGLKFGEMERDCLIGHGTALILKERLLDESDKSEALFCEKCGFIAVHSARFKKDTCHVCREDTTITKIVISYAFKLLLQELMSLGIAPRVELANRM